MKQYFLLIFFLFGARLLWAQQPVVIQGNQSYFPLKGAQVWAVEDAEHKFDLTQLQQLPDSAFTVPNEGYTNFGITSSAYWIRFKLVNQLAEKIYLRIINPVLDTAELFILRNESLVMNKEVLAKKPEFNLPNSPFLLPVSTDTLTCYLKVSARVPLYVQMYVLPESQMTEFILWQSALDILFFGAILIMLLYNLFIGITTRNVAYFYYVGYSFFLWVTVFFFKGYPVPLLGKYSYLVDDFFAVHVSLTSILLALFTKEFLQLKQQYKRGKQLLDIAIYLHSIAIAVFLMGYVNANVFLYQIFNIYSNIAVGWSAFYLYRKNRYRPALLFLIAYLIYLALSGSINLTFANILPTNSLSLLYYLHIGSSIELVVFSIALGNQINIYRKEKAEAQAENLRLIQEQNLMLEQKVQERTLALNQSNEELSITLEMVARQRDDIISSINYARRIQSALLPKTDFIRQHIPQLLIYYVPKDIVSGDFYWFTALSNEEYILAVGDCTGHGVSGAFMTIIGNTLLDQIINKDRIGNPAKILTELDNRLLQTLQQQGFDTDKVHDGMDISILRFNQIQQKLTWASAKRPLWIFEQATNELVEYKGNKFPIGSSQFKEKLFVEQEISLNTGDIVYAFTDGYPDQFGKEGKFTIKKFRELLKRMHAEPFSVQEKHLSETFEAWKGAEKQTDDILIAGIRI